MQSKPLVSICCLSYNHEPFLRQCLDGFMMQKTTFDFEVLIHDDASTDNSQLIIREYEEKFPDVVKPIYQKENQYSKGVKVSTIFNESRAKGKYIALCEGDDYWIDPYKLQKQVDFLENNLDFSFVVSRYIVFNEDTNSFDDVVYPINYRKMLNSKGGIVITHDEFYKKWITKTLTSLYRVSNMLEIQSKMKDLKYDKDVHLFSLLLLTGKGFCFDNIFGCYRKQSGGVFNSLPASEKRKINYKIFKELYNMEKHNGALYHIGYYSIMNLFIGDTSCFFDFFKSYGIIGVFNFFKSVFYRFI